MDLITEEAIKHACHVPLSVWVVSYGCWSRKLQIAANHFGIATNGRWLKTGSIPMVNNKTKAECESERQVGR